MYPTPSHKAAFRGQAAIETLVMAGFALAFIIPLALLFFSSSSLEIGKSSIAQAKVAARTIASEAGEIYLQGAGAKKLIAVNYPDGMLDGRIENGLVVLTINADSRQMDVVGETFANISGNISGRRYSGIQSISLVNINGSYVNITYGR